MIEEIIVFFAKESRGLSTLFVMAVFVCLLPQFMPKGTYVDEMLWKKIQNNFEIKNYFLVFFYFYEIFP